MNGQISLNEDDFSMLKKIAKIEYREPRNQAVILIKEAFESRGFLKNIIEIKEEK
jgi:hypothetical protein